MKRLITLLVTSWLLSGCGSSISMTSENQQTEIKNLATYEMSYDIGGERLLNRRNYLGVINNPQEYEALRAEIAQAKYDSNFTLKPVDFNNAKVLLYLTKYNARGQLNEYNESITIDNQNAIIEQHFTGHLKEYEAYCGRAVQLRIYQVDNAINNITMIHEDEILQIDMHSPIQESETNITNISTTTSTIGNEEIRVFDHNASWQRFLIEHHNSELINVFQNQTIDFEQDNILIFTHRSLYYDVYRMEEIVHQLNTKTTITWQYIPVNYMYSDQVAPLDEYITRVYKVSKEIESVEANYIRRETVKIDMVSGVVE